jgi:hypothetical protein
MVPMLSLWLPILLSAVLVFAVSSVIHMFLGYHASDYQPVPDEDGVMDALRAAGVQPGSYAVPHATGMKEMGSPEYVEKYSRGPVALITVGRSGPPSISAELTQWFLFCLIMSFFAAYVASRALGAGADYIPVFRMVSTVAFIGYAVGSWQESIWFRRPWSVTAKGTFDGLIYALLTAGVFGWLWPS